MKPFALKFYQSKAWKACRKTYIQSVGGLCERCYKAGRVRPAYIVHHKIFLTPENINDSSVTLNWSNLEALCRECHEREHRRAPERYEVDSMGRVVALDPAPLAENA